MEDMDFGRTSIDEVTTTSGDESTETSIDAFQQISIDDTQSEAGKFSLTNHDSEKVVLGEPKGQQSNEINQTINEQGTAIPVKINSILKRDHETKLPLQDYLNSGRTYSNRSAIKLPKDDTKKSGVSLEYLFLEQNQFGIYQIDDDALSDLEQHVDCVGIQTLKDRYPDPNIDSFTRNYDAIVGSRQGRGKFRLNQAFTGNRKMATSLNGKINMIYSELMRKFDALSEHIKRLDSQVAENATAIKREM
ncbi:hypothetical protein DY000_02015120 [Brassica cretica]|uniref:Uncharacterized protein n=1 Tax=Brassica cretica TaxID=69181 RepID=A0ABQ7DAL3_BRACR|nr:hypothetical protein DY000_02015120 [Brassica cretica]